MPNKKKNIVLIMTDQLRKDALGCYGNTICKTPNIDKLCKSGRRFDNTYTVAPVCSPARASMMTGLYPHRHGVMLNTHIGTRTTRGLSLDYPTYSKEMKKQGYQMEYYGKWHVSEDNDPTDYGFDNYVPLEFDFKKAKRMISDDNEFIEFSNGKQLIWAKTEMPFEEDRSYKLAKQVEEYIKDYPSSSHKNNPFFLRADFLIPHFANIVPEPFGSMYDDVKIPKYPNFDEDYKNKPYSQKRKHQQWALEGKDWDWWEQIVRMYYADVSYIDFCCGLILDAIADAGFAEDTIVVFTTDHGDSNGSHKHFEKGGTMYDEVMNIPMIIRWPEKTIGGSICKEFCRNMDLVSTFISAANGVIPDDIDADDLTPLMDGNIDPKDWRDSVYCEYHGDVWGMTTQRMVANNEYKYVYNPYDIDELYDRQKDPYEMVNLAYDEDYYEAYQEMRARLLGWIDETKDVFTYDFVRRNFPDPIIPQKPKNMSSAI